MIAVAVIVGLVLVNLLTEDNHPVRQTLLGLGGGLILVLVSEVQARREAIGKPPLELPGLSEEWSLRLTIVLATVAGLALCAFAIGAALHG